MNKCIFFLTVILSVFVLSGKAQWSFNGADIHNNNTGNVGIGISTPSSLLDVAKNMTEPQISVRNLGGSGGATYRMFDQVSGADWKFKATAAGGFKIRDHAFGLDVIQVEPNSAANVLYINASGNLGIGETSPAAKLTVGSGDKFQVEGTRGSLTFTDDSASIKFPVTSGGNTPMIYMFSGGTSNADRMVLSHSPSFSKWGIEYHDTSDVIYFRSSSGRRFAFELSTGDLGIGVDNPAFPIDLVGRMRIRSDGTTSGRPGIWFSNQANTFDRALIGMTEPDSTIGIWSQHLNKWAIEFEVMREPRIGVNIPAGSPPRAEIHLYHTNFGGSNDGLRIQNEGSNAHYWNLYTSNASGDLEFYDNGIVEARIANGTGIYTAVSDENFKTGILPIEEILPKVMSLEVKRYQYINDPEKKNHYGLLAQELELVFPENVYSKGDEASNGIYTVDYASLSIIALKAIQEQQVQIEELKEEIRALKVLVEESR